MEVRQKKKKKEDKTHEQIWNIESIHESLLSKEMTR